MKVKITSDSFRPHGLYSPWNSPGQNTGVASCSLLQGIFPTHGSNPGLLHCRQILYQLSHHGSPRILEWVKPIPAPEDLPSPGIEPRSFRIAGKLFTREADLNSLKVHGLAQQTCLSTYSSVDTRNRLLPCFQMKRKSLSRVQLFRPKSSRPELEWSNLSLFKRISQTRDQTQASRITKKPFTS